MILRECVAGLTFTNPSVIPMRRDRRRTRCRFISLDSDELQVVSVLAGQPGCRAASSRESSSLRRSAPERAQATAGRDFSLVFPDAGHYTGFAVSVREGTPGDPEKSKTVIALARAGPRMGLRLLYPGRARAGCASILRGGHPSHATS